eukprot:scaffold334453_cov32-Prasinocladus_malaysianus.AAC.1
MAAMATLRRGFLSASRQQSHAGSAVRAACSPLTPRLLGGRRLHVGHARPEYSFSYSYHAAFTPGP